MLLWNHESKIQDSCPPYTLHEQSQQTGMQSDENDGLCVLFTCSVQEYISKINNVVWTCSILHNLLLGFDGTAEWRWFLCRQFPMIHHMLSGLDKLWTEEDYLSSWYADADADVHPEYDKYTADHAAIVVSRANARLRNFRTQWALGKRRPTGAIPVPQQSGSLVPELHQLEPMSQVIFSEADHDPLEWQDGFEAKRETLIEHFNIFWNENKVQWLPFPGTAKFSARKTK